MVIEGVKVVDGLVVCDGVMVCDVNVRMSECHLFG